MTPRSASNSRVSCTMRSPASSARVCRTTSYSSACCTLRNEFRFLISTLVPSSVAPCGRSETLASQRSEPSSMLPSHTPMKTQHGAEGLADTPRPPRASAGRDGTPSPSAACPSGCSRRGSTARRRESPSCTSLPTSSSRCRRWMPNVARAAREIDVQRAVLGQRLLVLTDLVVLRHVRVVVVLPREAARRRSPCSSKASAVRTANSTARRLITGSVPGMPRQIGQVWLLGGAPNVVAQPQNILERVASWACTSSPMTVSYVVRGGGAHARLGCRARQGVACS